METMRETDFQTKIHILSTIYATQRDNDFFRTLCEVYDLGFQIATSEHMGYTKGITEKGIEEVELAWLTTLTLLRVEDIGYKDMFDLLKKSERYAKFYNEGEVSIDEDEVH